MPQFLSENIPQVLQISFAKVQFHSVVANGPDRQMNMRMFGICVQSHRIVMASPELILGQCPYGVLYSRRIRASWHRKDDTGRDPCTVGCIAVGPIIVVALHPITIQGSSCSFPREDRTVIGFNVELPVPTDVVDMRANPDPLGATVHNDGITPFCQPSQVLTP